MDENEVTLIGLPSAPGASDAQLSGDIVIERNGSSFVVYVDPDSGGGAQLWSEDTNCFPATGQDVTRVSCDIPEPDLGTAYVNLADIDERGSGRIFAINGDFETTFYGSEHDDEFYGGAGDDFIWGGDGADSLHGRSGDDEVEGGAGPDYIDVENDVKAGETGVDVVDCNDEDSRGSDNDPAKGDVNEVDFDKGEDTVIDCGLAGAPVAKSNPTIGAAPMIGVPVEGKNGEWEGKNLKFTYRWVSCEVAADSDCQDVVPLTSDAKKGTTYTPTEADEGRVLLFAVTATNVFGSATSESAFSSPVTKPLGPAVIYIPSALVDSAPKVGTAMKFHTGVWETKTGDEFQYEIESCYTLQSGNERCRTRTSGKTAAGATVSYTPVKDDRDTRLRITVTGIRKVGAAQLKTSASSLRTMTIPTVRFITIPDAWEPKQVKQDTYRFTKESVLAGWVETNRKKEFGFDLNVVRVGLAEIRSSKQYSSLRKYLPDLPANDGAIISTNPGFRDDLKGYPGIKPRPILTVVVYDKLRDLDNCAAALNQPAFLNSMLGGPLFVATAWLTKSQCPSWRVQWSQAESADTASRVEAVRVDKSVANGVATNTIVVTVTKPKVQSLFMTVMGMSREEALQYPDTASLTWDGDAKAGVRTSFQVWPMLAATGQVIYGAKYGAIEVYDTNGVRISTWEMNHLNTGGRLDLKPTGVSAIFATPGTARVLVRVFDAAYDLHEVFMDIKVSAPWTYFATLDGRCWEWTGTAARDTQGLSCPADTEPAKAVAAFLTQKYKGVADRCLNGDTYCVLREAFAREGATDARSNPTVSISLVNTTFSVSQAQARGLVTPRSNCEWWNLVCKVVEFFTPKKTRVAVRPYKRASAPEPPKAPPAIAEIFAATTAIGPGTSALGITDAGGCTQVGAGLTVGGCPGLGGADLKSIPANSGALLNLDGAGLINLDGNGLINLDGNGLINLDGNGLIDMPGGAVQQVSARVVDQSGGSLSVPTSVPLIGAGGLK